MIKYADSDGNIIVEATECIMTTFHNRLFINPGIGLPHKEGAKVIVFTPENMEKLWKYHNDQMIEVLKDCKATKEHLLELTEKSIKVIDKLQAERDQLKKELSEQKKIDDY